MLEGTQHLSYKHSVKDGLEPTKMGRETTSWQENNKEKYYKPNLPTNFCAELMKIKGKKLQTPPSL